MGTTVTARRAVSLRRRAPLGALLGANLLSVTGTTITTVAVPWFVLETTGSAARTGVTAAVSLAPVVVSAGLGGAIVDRVGYRRASVISDVAGAVLVAAIPALWLTAGLPFGVLLALLFARCLFATPGETAREALLPEVAAHAGTPLERGMSTLDGVSRAGKMVGAPLAGALIAVFGAADLLFADGITFAVSAALVGAGARAVAEPRHPHTGSYGTRLREGLAYLWRDRLLRAMCVMVLVTNLLDAAYGQVLLPVYARDVLHSALALGAISGVFSAGAVVGTVLYGAVGARLPRRATFVLSFLLGGGPRFLLLMLGPPLPVLLGLLFLFAVGTGSINPLLGVVQVERIPGTLRARVMGATTAVAWAAMPLGGLLGGLLAARAGVHAALLFCGAAYILTTLAPLVGSTWRALDRPAPSALASEAR